MERPLEQRRNDAGPVRVRSAGWTAQCPQCEAHDFHAPDSLQFLSCMSCGAQTHQTELLQQISRNARLVAEVLAERAKHVVPLTN